MGEKVRNKERLLALIANNRPKLQALGVKQLGLFGSFVRGEQQAESDIDLLVEFLPGKKTFDNFVQLGFLNDAASSCQ
jgi:predicted nucleotidyltransferase